MPALFDRHKPTGSSIVVVMIAVVILGIVAVVMAETFAQQDHALWASQEKVDRAALRQYVSSNFDCPSTLAAIPASCGKETFFEVHARAPGNPVLISIPQNGTLTKVGIYGLRALCSDCPTCPKGRALEVQAVRFSRGSDSFSKDLLRGWNVTWADLGKGDSNQHAIPIDCQ